MNIERLASSEELLVSEYEYEDASVIVVDFGPDAEGSVEVVDGTAVVVLDGAEYDIDLPDGDATAFMNNGVLTVELEGDT